MAASGIFLSSGTPSTMVEPATAPCAGALLWNDEVFLTGTPDLISSLIMAGLRNEVVLVGGFDTRTTCAGRKIIRLTQVAPTGFIRATPQTPGMEFAIIPALEPSVVAPPTSPCAGTLLRGTDLALTGTPDIVNRLMVAGQMRQPVLMFGMFLGTMCEGRRLFRVTHIV